MPETTRKQEHRAVAFKMSGEEDKLLLVSMQGTEALGRMFQFELELISDHADNQPIAHDKVLGQNVTIRLDRMGGETRYFNGWISWFALVGMEENRKEAKIIYHYQATMVPSLWFLTRKSNCRIFQEKTVPDIIKEICKGIDIDFQLSGTYATWNYCVQYRESDFNFISRLMEEEGIYYYFKQEDGKHTVVFCDSPDAHKPAPDYDEMFFDQPDLRSTNDAFLWDWVLGFEVTPTQYTQTDYNMETPRTKLEQKSKVQHSHDPSTYEIYDYPGGYEKADEGRTSTSVRMKELEAQYGEATAKSSARGLFAGATFKMQGHRIYTGEQYLITAISHQLRSDGLGAGLAGGGAGNVSYRSHLTCLPKKYDFRTLRLTPKPVVQGPQTAVVVGPAGEEIYTDKYGRVKVQFHWDREGKKDEHSSCWIRVSQNWAGKEWGIVFNPRIGQEVIVDFLEGDPDRPIITGRVYNAEQMPPYALPANQTQSGIKTRSSKGGEPENFNEIRFEDKKGSEQLFIHAEKNQDIEVENDETHWVGHDRTKTIDRDETSHIKRNRTETVDKDETITIHGNRTETVDKNETITIHENRTETVDKNESITIGGTRTENVAKDETITIGKSRTSSVGEHESSTVAKNSTVSVGENQQVNVGKAFTFEAGETILLKTGAASITMKSDGTIIIKGKDITIEGSGKITAKASSNVVIKGSQIKQN